MPNGLSNKEKKAFIIEALNTGKLKTDMSYADYINFVDNYVKNNPVSEINPILEGGEKFNNPEFLESIKNQTPNQIFNTIRENRPFGEDSTSVVDFANQLNQSGIYPYKAKVTRIENGGYDLGFTKDIAGYEAAWSNTKETGGKPGGYLYFKKYTDGSYDLLEKGQFDKEKGFNILPNSLQSRYNSVINEG